ncbi:MAG: hypothetical protein IID32_04850 [Planctomycetes bacterium]|nr:hypothetical protein [Planctomycetota bacterium]
MKDSILGILSRRTALALNAVIVGTYVAIAVFAPTPWVMFGGFLLVAIVIRCATLWWMASTVREDTGDSSSAAFGMVVLNLLLGLLFAGALLGALWVLGHFWLSGVKIIVPLIGVFVAYKSTFPVV